MKIAIYAFDGITMFHLAVPQMVFGEVSRQGLADWETELFSDEASSIVTSEGNEISGVQALDAAQGADVIVIPSWFEDLRAAPAGLSAMISTAHDCGSTIVGLCLGAVPLAQTTVLNGRTAVTHWRAFDEVVAKGGSVTWDNSVLYLDHGDVLTSAGTAAGLDACLHFVRAQLGAEAALHVARSLVIAPHRDGGQAQFVERPISSSSDNGSIAEVLQWIDQHLEGDLRIDQLAAIAHMSSRTFLRAFQAATGTSPASWVRRRRLDEARRLLELTQVPVEQIAPKVGFGGSATLRQNFKAEFGITPAAYRRRFSVA